MQNTGGQGFHKTQSMLSPATTLLMLSKLGQYIVKSNAAQE